MTVAENNIRPVVSEKATDVSPIGKDISDPDTFSVTNTTDKSPIRDFSETVRRM